MLAHNTAILVILSSMVTLIQIKVETPNGIFKAVAFKWLIPIQEATKQGL
jgi:hypothetical protein